MADVPRTFIGPRYIVEVEPGTFGAYRDLSVEEKDPRTGKARRELVKKVGPIALYRRCEGSETPDLHGVGPDGNPIPLKEL